MNVFCDYHHRDLLASLYFLFEKRLGYKLYVPRGMEYFREGLISIYEDHLAEQVSNQFLVGALEGCTILKTDSDGTDTRYDQLERLPIRTVTLEAFKNIKFDILVCTLPHHVDRFFEIKTKYQPQAKIILQSGNNSQLVSSKNKLHNILTSSVISYLPEMTPLYLKFPWEQRHKLYNGINYIENKLNICFYHQEFPDIFSADFSKKQNKIVSLLHYNDEKYNKLIYSLKNKLSSEFEFKIHGCNNPDGSIGDICHEARELVSSKFLIHMKQQGDGYGHNIHRAITCGTPIISSINFYKSVYNSNDYMTACLIFDQNTFVNYSEGMNTNILANEIKTKIDNFPYFYEKCIEKFKMVMNFDEEEIKIKKFIENLV
jgi:hypothetical protein